MPYVRKEFGEDENTIAYRKHQQEPAVSLKAGTVITIPAEVKHWHGAKKDS